MGFLGEYETLSSADARRALLFQWLNQRRHELYAELRENAPVFATPDFFLVTRYQDVKDIIENGDHFKARAYATSGSFVLGKDKEPKPEHAFKYEHEHDKDRDFLSKLLPDADLETYVRDTADTIAANAPLTVNAVKYIVGQATKDETQRDLGRAAEMVKKCFQSNDYVEGRNAFMEKRKPVFTGT